MKELIIFGSGDTAQLADFYFKDYEDFRVVAFCVDDAYKKSDSFCDKPLISLSDVSAKYPPDKYWAFVAVGYNAMNDTRTEKYRHLKNLGYKFASYISPMCSRFTDDIGENCFIFEDNTIQPFVTIGDNNVLWSGNHIGHHTIIGNNNFFTSHVVVSGRCQIGSNCFLGVNATLRDEAKVADYTLIAAGSLIVKDTESYQVIKGSPGKPTGANSKDIKL